jgi:hypothetical protein
MPSGGAVMPMGNFAFPKPDLLTLSEAVDLLCEFGAAPDQAKEALRRACADGRIADQMRCRSWFGSNGLHGGGPGSHPSHAWNYAETIDWTNSSMVCRNGRKEHYFTDIKLRRDDIEAWIGTLPAPKLPDTDNPAPRRAPTYSTRLLNVLDVLREKMAADPYPARWTREVIEAECRAMGPDLSQRDIQALGSMLLPDEKRRK